MMIALCISTRCYKCPIQLEEALKETPAKINVFFSVAHDRCAGKRIIRLLLPVGNRVVRRSPVTGNHKGREGGFWHCIESTAYAREDRNRALQTSDDRL